MPFIDAYRTDTGAKVRVPESHLAIFPGALSKTPRQKAEDKAARAASTPKPATSAAATPKEDA